jgi:hypothetical protein
MTTKITIGALAALSMLSACGGSNGGGGAPAATPFQQAVATNAALADRLDAAGETPDATVNARTGTATYNGLAGFVFDAASKGVTSATVDDEDLEVIAALQLTADFDNDAINGTMSDFMDSNSEALTGSATIIASSIINNDIIVPFNGSVTVGGTTENMNGVLEGTFMGPNAEGISGDIDGMSNSGTAGSLIGLWAVEQ